jgi:molybdopterin-guanine dinucleotide biosynthesis protein A
VLVCAGDMPFVPGELLRAIAATDPDGAPAVVAASGGGEVQPLLGCYLPQALAMLPSSDRPLREIVEAIGPRRFEVADPLALFNVNTPGDLERAEAVLVSRASQM